MLRRAAGRAELAAAEKPDAVWEWEGNRAANTLALGLKTRGVAVRRKLGLEKGHASPRGCPRERSRASSNLEATRGIAH